MASSSKIVQSASESSFLRSCNKAYPNIKGGKGSYLETTERAKVFDAAIGAAISFLGYRNGKVIRPGCDQLNTGIPFLSA